MKIKNKIGFISSDIKKNPTSNQIEPIELNLDSEDLDEELSIFYRFINKLLDTENLIILAGSGTSLTFNKRVRHPIAPSMWHLWDFCQKDDEHFFELVLAATKYNDIQHEKDEHGKAKPDIELLLSLCESSLAVGNLSVQRTNQVNRFLDRAKNIILSKTNFTEKIQDPADWVSHDKFIRAMGRRSAQQQRLKIFTTNYDLSFEQAASNVGFVVIDGFDFTNPSFFNPMWFNYDIVNRRHSKNSDGAYISNVLHLYKMHGSVDWRKINGRVKKLGSESLKGEPVFIYPSSSKYQASYDSPYLDIMSSFLEVLKQPRTAVLCLGFGFNDKHINNALMMALRTNPEFMLMIATKDSFNETSAFNIEIRKLLMAAINHGDGRIAITDSTFEQFSKLLPERRSTTPEDELFKAFEKITASMK